MAERAVKIAQSHLDFFTAITTAADALGRIDLVKLSELGGRGESNRQAHEGQAGGDTKPFSNLVTVRFSHCSVTPLSDQ